MIGYTDIPTILFLSKGYYYRYRIIRDLSDRITPLLDVDALEIFVTER